MSALSNAATTQPQLVGFRRVWRALKQLFYEITGAAFAVLAFGWINAALRAWTKDAARWLVGMAVAVALLFVYFSISSFRRARKL
jgi:hypothetical protein